VGCHNRPEPLRLALRTWLPCPEPDEIVVVDYGSDPPIEGAVAELRDPRVLLARVVDQPSWQNARCHNLELQLAAKDLFLHLDGDHLLERSFFACHPMNKSQEIFYSGFWHGLPRSISDQRNLSGALLVPRAHLLGVGGYNERLVHYGSEDDDLWRRLAAAGHRRLLVNLATIRHLPHPDSSRYENLAIGRRLGGSQAQNLDQLRTLSRHIAESRPWSTADRMTRWASREIGKRRLECRELPAGVPAPPGWREICP
jgi:hypothetical protein